LSDDRQQVRTLATSLAATVASFAGDSRTLKHRRVVRLKFTPPLDWRSTPH
jgi:hypothetical protein